MTKSGPSSIYRILAFIVGALWYLILLVNIIVYGILLTLMMGWTPPGAKLGFHYKLPIKVSYEENAGIPSGPNEKMLEPVRIVGHTDIIISGKPGRAMAIFIGIGAFLLSFGVLLIVRQLHLFLRSVRAGHAFESQSPKRLRSIGCLVTALGPIYSIWNFILGMKYVHRISLPGASLSVDFHIPLESIFLGLLILLIAQIFDAGVKLQEEQELTV